MATSPRRVCWDACAWIALIQGERIVEGGVDRVTRCRAVIEQAKDAEPQKIADFFEQDYLLLVNVDKDVGERARQLMMAGIPKLKPADACHLATAAITPNTVELHTFDAKLLDLNGSISKADGVPLKVCWPDVGVPPPPLLTT